MFTGQPVLGLIFFRYPDHKFTEVEKKMPQQASGRRKIGKTDYQAPGSSTFLKRLTSVTCGISRMPPVWDVCSWRS